MNDLQEERFRRQVDSALSSVRTILENARSPQLAAEVPHTYSDKYALAELLTNTTLAAVLNALEAIGVTRKSLKKLIKWTQKGKTITLRFNSEEACVYDREETREVESSETSTVVKIPILGAFTSTSKVITKVTEFFWKFSLTYQISAFPGTARDEEEVLQRRANATCEVVTLSKVSPRPEMNVPSPFDVILTWLLQRINMSDGIFNFQINRSDPACRTPRRNHEVQGAISFFLSFKTWALAIDSYLAAQLGMQPKGDWDLSVLWTRIFIPTHPLLEKIETSSSTSKQIEAEQSGSKSAALVSLPPHSETASPVLLPPADVNKFLWEQKRSMAEAFDLLSKTLPSKDDPKAQLLTTAEGSLIVLIRHIYHLLEHAMDCIDYIEEMLYSQFQSALGKSVSAADFAVYMRYHYRRLFHRAFEARPFAHSVRQGERDAEGIISIESQLSDGSIASPIITVSRKIAAGTPLAQPMRFAINAATNVEFGGHRYLHGWVNHQFSEDTGQTCTLVARARQFSSFILLVGRIASAEVFDPKAAIVIKNKDELRIPLLMETIPTPKEFRDAIESMSPEQQRFCKAYRAMQLESTLFGLVVIQIRPQLEKLLNLFPDSLTKHVMPTQTILDLFLRLQIPSDLLSFNEELHVATNLSPSTPEERLANVFQNAGAVGETVEQMQQEQLRAVEMKRAEATMKELVAQRKTLRDLEDELVEIDEAHTRIMRSVEKQRDTRSEMRRQDEMMESLSSSSATSLLLSKVSRSKKRFKDSAPRDREIEANIKGPPSSGRGRKSGKANEVAAPSGKPQKQSHMKVKQEEQKAWGGDGPQRGKEGAKHRHRSNAGVENPFYQAASGGEPSESPTTPSLEPPVSDPHLDPQQAIKQEHQEQDQEDAVQVSEGIDFTKFPRELDAKYEQLDEDSALRPTIISIGETWIKKHQKSILASPETTSLHTDLQKAETNQAFDILDALSRSGSLSVDSAELHVIIAATHCFAESLVDTVVQNNVNPIEKVERSTLIVASTLLELGPLEFVKREHHDRLRALFPLLIESDDNAADDE